MVVVKEYPGTRPDLYVIIGLGLLNVKNRIADFRNFRGIYDDAYIDAIQAEADAAEMLPDDSARTQPHESLRLQVISTSGTCLKLFRHVKRYIASAFPEEQEIQWTAAGWDFYAEAANDNWPAVKSLMTSAMGYVSTNLSALTAHQNMPAGFPLLLSDAYDAFLLKLNDFYQAEETAQTGTQTKLEAENAVFRKVMNCLLDGATIFEDDEAVRKQYEWMPLSTLVSPPHSTATPPAPQAEAKTTYTIDGQQVQGGSQASEQNTNTENAPAANEGTSNNGSPAPVSMSQNN